MLAKIIAIGNSKGIRIPNNILKQMNIDKTVELILNEKNYEIILKPVRKTRDGWENAFKNMNANGDDKLVIEDSLDLEEWEW